MKSRKYNLIFLAVVTAVLCITAMANTQPSADKPAPPAERPTPSVRTNPALVGIQQLYVIVVPLYAELDTAGVFWDGLRLQIERKVAETTIMVLPAPSLDRPFRGGNIAELRVNIDPLGPINVQRYVYRVQTSVTVDVRPQVDPAVVLRSDVWMVGATVQPASPQDEFATVSNLVMEQVEAFISAWLAANRQAGQLSEADSRGGAASPQPAPQQTMPQAGPTAAKYEYVSSKYSKIFHKPDCRWAKQILPKNLVGYNSKEEAIKAGKRPCKICKP
jgi:hypothetical protein